VTPHPPPSGARRPRHEFSAAAWRDLAYAVRQFRRTPIFAVGVVLTLGFGIGASATVYSWMAGVVLRPLPAVRDVGALVTVRPERRNGFGISLPEYTEWRDQATTVSGLAAASMSLFAVAPRERRGPGSSTPLYGMFVSANYFDLLGVPPWRGRTFGAGENVDGAPPVVILSYAAWRSTFDAAPDILGRTITINGQPVSVVGIAPPLFGGNVAVARFDLWVPLATRPILVPAELGAWKRRDARWLDAIGRLRPGVTLAQANAEFQQIARRQAQTYAESNGRGARAVPLDVGTARELRPLFVALVIVTVLVVLLICSNVANLLLTRATARDRELAVRLSLGASRGRIVRQLMTEHALLAVLGGGVGVVIAAFGDRYLRLLLPRTSVAFVVPSQLDAPFLAFVLGVTALSVLAFGLAPAVTASRVRLVETLKNGAGGSSASASRLRSALVVAQFALALSVLVCTALILRRDRDVHSMDLGYRRGEQVLVVQTEMSIAGYGETSRWRDRMVQVLERAASIPGVEKVAIGSFLPLSIVGYSRRTVAFPGRPIEPGTEDRVLVNGVSPGYFDLMGIEIPLGRDFSDGDAPDRSGVVVVNEAFAAKYLEGRWPLQQRFTLGDREVTIVGVARNGRYDYRDIDNAGIPLVYFAWTQAPTGLVSLHLRVGGDPGRLINDARAAVHGVDPAMPLLPVVTLQEHADVPFSISGSALKITGVLGVAALLLASMGLFSVVSYGVSLRMREIGIRVAVGATRQRVMRLVLSGAVRLTMLGAAAGIASAMALVAVLRSRLTILPQATLPDVVIPALVLGACAVVAGLLPARRAASVDPARTLRTD
jgi:predicted permease